ncbi:outer membrane channel protein TolC [soil metagenome]
MTGGRLTILFLGLPILSSAQSSLSLDDALRLARERNGTFRSGVQDYRAARARVDQAYSAFFPEVLANFSYSNSNDGIVSGNSLRSSQIDQRSTQANVTYTFLDAGQRSLAYRAARSSAASSFANATDQLRQTLFLVSTQYYETLRAQELQKVTDAQLQRAQSILAQTRARVEVGDAARREALQASADALNAQVAVLTARNLTAANAANLKASIGLEQTEGVPPLEAVPAAPPASTLPPLAELKQEATDNRPDLRARRLNIESGKYQTRQAEVEAGVTYGIDGTYDLQVDPRRQANRGFTVFASYPIFDAGLRRAVVRERRSQTDSLKELLYQAERQARADVESAYIELSQNRQRLDAADAAVAAAQENYAAALGSQEAGVATIIDVLTAQVSLVTAESARIQALFDTLISDLRLRLASGRVLPGESAIAA